MNAAQRQDEANCTVFVGNLDGRVKEEILFELFLQAGPLTKVKIATDKDGKPKPFGFVYFKHTESVPYAIALLNGICLYGRPIHLQYFSGSTHIPENGTGSPFNVSQLSLCGTQNRNNNIQRSPFPLQSPANVPRTPLFFNPLVSPPPFFNMAPQPPCGTPPGPFLGNRQEFVTRPISFDWGHKPVQAVIANWMNNRPTCKRKRGQGEDNESEQERHGSSVNLPQGHGYMYQRMKKMRPY